MDPFSVLVVCLAVWAMLKRAPDLAREAAAEFQAGRRGETTPAAEDLRRQVEGSGVAPSSAGGALRRFLGNAWRNHWNNADRRQQQRQQRRDGEVVGRQPDPTSNRGPQPNDDTSPAPDPSGPEPSTPPESSGPGDGDMPGRPDPVQPAVDVPGTLPGGEDPEPATPPRDSDPQPDVTPEPLREPIRVGSTLGDEPDAQPVAGPDRVRLTPAIDPPQPTADHPREVSPSVSGDQLHRSDPRRVPESEQPPLDDWNPSDAFGPAETEALRHELFGTCSGDPSRCPHCAEHQRDRSGGGQQTNPASDARAPIRVPATVGTPETGTSPVAVLELEGTPDMSNALATRGIPVTGVVSGAAETLSIYRETEAAILAFQQRLTALGNRMASLGEQTLCIVQFAGGSSVVVRMSQATEALAALRASSGACGHEVLPLLTATRAEFTRRNS